jgi:prepilin-type N-terminal cleavage/methylation domain-containing protein
MLQNIKKRNEGFTIIEVLIVLAIAGLILLVVFLAVPALQRNQRNTARKQDASRIAGAATDFVSNNNGTLPAATADLDTIVTSAGTLGQYKLVTSGAGANFTLNTAGTAVSALSGGEKIQLVTAQTCGTSGATTPGTSRQMALQYTVENGGGSWTGLCLNVN